MKRESFVDVIKGVCILFVVIAHSSWTNQQRLAYLFPFWISMAVPFFMVISGYVSSKSYLRRGISSIRTAYSPKLLLEKITYYSLPALITFIIYTILYATVSCTSFPGASGIIYNFFPWRIRSRIVLYLSYGRIRIMLSTNLFSNTQVQRSWLDYINCCQCGI